MSCIGAKIGASLSASAERVVQVRSRVVIGLLRYKEPPISPQRSHVTRGSLAVLMLSLLHNPLESLLTRLTHINNIEASSGPIRGIYLDQVMDLRK